MFVFLSVSLSVCILYIYSICICVCISLFSYICLFSHCVCFFCLFASLLFVLVCFSPFFLLLFLLGGMVTNRGGNSHANKTHLFGAGRSPVPPRTGRSCTNASWRSSKAAWRPSSLCEGRISRRICATSRGPRPCLSLGWLLVLYSPFLYIYIHVLDHIYRHIYIYTYIYIELYRITDVRVSSFQVSSTSFFGGCNLLLAICLRFAGIHRAGVPCCPGVRARRRGGWWVHCLAHLSEVLVQFA